MISILKSEMGNLPDNTFLVYPDEVMDVIEDITSSFKPAPYTDKWEVIRVFKEAVANGSNNQVYSQHIMNVRNMLDRNSTFEHQN